MPNWGRFSASTTYNKTNATKRFSANVSTMVAGLLFCVVMTGRRRSGMGTRRGMQPFAVASMGRGESKALQFALLVDPF